MSTDAYTINITTWIEGQQPGKKSYFQFFSQICGFLILA